MTGVAAALARGGSSRSRSLLLAIGAGTAFGTTSALARTVLTVDGSPGAGSTVLLAGAGIALLAPVGFLLTQGAYQAGHFAAALATITVTDPLVASTGAVLLMHEPLPSTAGEG